MHKSDHRQQKFLRLCAALGFAFALAWIGIVPHSGYAGEKSCPDLAPADASTYEYYNQNATQPENPSTKEKAPHAHLADLQIVDPQFKAGPDFRKLPDCDRRRRMLECVVAYEKSLRQMEFSIAHAAIHNSEVVGIARKIAQRMEMLIRASATMEILGGDADRRPTGEESEKIEIEMNARFLRAFGDCKVEDAGCVASVEYCEKQADKQDCLDAQAKRLRDVIRTGNLRETMFILYRSNQVLTQNVSAPQSEDPAQAAVQVEKNSKRIKWINRYLSDHGERWQLTGIPESYKGRFILPRVGYGKDNWRLRDTKNNGKCEPYKQRIGDFGIMALELIPLSERERAFLRQQSGAADDEELKQRPFPYLSGESCFTMKKEISDPAFANFGQYLQSAYSARIPMISGISGTTDSILGLGRVLGLKSDPEKKPGDFELLRAAALGWLVSERDHSAHEVMTASVSFPEIQPSYRFHPDYYKEILPGSRGFAHAVENHQHAQHGRLPQEVLDRCLSDGPGLEHDSAAAQPQENGT